MNRESSNREFSIFFDFSQNWETGDRWLTRAGVREGKQRVFAADLS